MNMVIRAGDSAVSLQVDEIGEVLDVSPASYERVPETLSAERRELIEGVYKLEGRLLLVLDTGRTLQVPIADASRADNTIH